VKPDKTLAIIEAGSRNVRFEDLLRLADAFGFVLVRVSGSHHILRHRAFPELLNLQSVDGRAKPYQVRQLMMLVARYSLHLKERP